MVKNLLNRELKVLSIGIPTFAQTLREQGCDVVEEDWKPSYHYDFQTMKKLAHYEREIEEGNQKAVEKIFSSEPVLMDIKYAYEAFPCMDRYTVGHAGPPIAWADMSHPLKGAILCVIQYEGLAKNDLEAEKLVKEGRIKLVPNHHLGAVGPMTGMLSYSMPLFEVVNAAHGNTAYSTFNEGLGKVLRFGAGGAEVLERLRWFRDDFAPLMKEAVRILGGINLKVVISKALAMGDEMHQRNIAASAVFLKTILPGLLKCTAGKEAILPAVNFLTGNEQFFLNLAMAASKAVMDTCRDIPYCSLVTAMCRNGTEFGIRVSALGDEWFRSPALMPEGLYFPGFSKEDANPDMGDSAIIETLGIGGFAMGAAPAVVKFLGMGSTGQAYRITNEMKKITVRENCQFQIPGMNFSGLPTGIDIRKVTEKRILPVINTGIAHKEAGIGQIGAGVVNAPIMCFEKALRRFVQELPEFPE